MSDLNYLTSPVTGGGVAIDRFQQLFILARIIGKKSTLEWAEYTWELLSRQGQNVVKDGRVLSLARENIDELLLQAN